jgi:histone H3/H4
MMYMPTEPLASGEDAAATKKASVLLQHLQQTMALVSTGDELSDVKSFVAANSSFTLPRPPPDELIPQHNVAQLMANSLPSDAKISKEIKLLVQHGLTEFIAFVTSEASDICTGNKVGHAEIKQALTNLGASAPPRGVASCNSRLAAFFVPRLTCAPFLRPSRALGVHTGLAELCVVARGDLMESPRVPKRKLSPAGIGSWSDDEESLQDTALVRGVSDEDIDLLLAKLEQEHEEHEDELFHSV